MILESLRVAYADPPTSAKPSGTTYPDGVILVKVALSRWKSGLTVP